MRTVIQAKVGACLMGWGENVNDRFCIASWIGKEWEGRYLSKAIRVGDGQLSRSSKYLVLEVSWRHNALLARCTQLLPTIIIGHYTTSNLACSAVHFSLLIL